VYPGRIIYSERARNGKGMKEDRERGGENEREGKEK